MRKIPTVIKTAIAGFLLLLANADTILAQCSTVNPAGCACPTTGSTDCILLPDIIAGKKSLNATAGWTEYAQNAGAPNKGLLRIDVATPNIGWGPLETVSTNNYICGSDTLYNFFPASNFLCPDGSAPKRLIKQRLYHKTGNTFQFTDRDAGWMQYHPSHGHIHIDDWGLYTLRLKDPSITDTLQWPVVNSGIKVSFCLIDLTTCSGSLGDCIDASGNILANTNFQNYGLGGGYSCNNIKQGISVGKVDIYHQGLDESFVKIPYEACNGTYFVMTQIDPDNHFLEMNENNNWLAAQIPVTKQRTSNTGPYSYIFSVKGNVICQNDQLELEASGASNYLWNTGASTQKITINQPGKYWVRATTPCGTATSDTLTISPAGNANGNLVIKQDTVCVGDMATLYASGNAHWYDAAVNGNLVFIGNYFQTGTLNSNTTFYVADQPSVLSGSLGPAAINFSNNGNYAASRNEYLIFNAFLPFKLKKVRIDASAAGSRIIQLRNQYGKVLSQKQVLLVQGQQEIDLDFFVPAGLNHQLGLSGTSPVGSLFMSTTANTNIGFPFKLNSVANIVGSSLGDIAFPFFYNWQVEVISTTCNSNSRTPVTAYVVPKPTVSVSGLLPVYHHNAPGVLLTTSPAGGVLNGAGIRGNYFYPRIAGTGSHEITYTVKTANCIASISKTTEVILDSTLLQDGFMLQLFNTPGSKPILWIVTRYDTRLEIRLVNSSGQSIRKMRLSSFTGSNFYDIDLDNLPKGIYFLQVRDPVSGKSKVLKAFN
jgi:hypothetical protein